ncbi:MAG TPA: cytochrome c [Xanthomonadaceae bacterium]|nr:cytochrome c [Xanthomonadaceae bacterium]
MKLAPVFAFAMFAVASLAHAGDPVAGQQKSLVCQACHGADGNTSADPSYPKLAGQYQDYLVHAMLAYKSGERDNAIMAGFMGTLSERDIRDLAAFYARQKGDLKDLREFK